MALLAVLAASALLGARAGHGKNLRVVKQDGRQVARILWVEPDNYGSPGQGSPLIITSLKPVLAAGQSYDVIDTEGYVGRVVIDGVDTEDTGCPGMIFYRGRSRFVTAPTRAPGSAMAIAASRKIPSDARMVLGEELSARGAPSAPSTLEPSKVTARQSLDVDGDGLPDALLQFGACADGATAGAPAFCFETWQWKRGSWVRVDEARLLYCH